MSGIVKVKSGSESDLMGAVANVGPVAVAVDGSSNAFRVSIELYTLKCSCVNMLQWSALEVNAVHSY